MNRFSCKEVSFVDGFVLIISQCLTPKLYHHKLLHVNIFHNLIQR
jgi:hypothetical protein